MNKLFIGVVEDINDPLKLNRVRVRIFGYHTENRDFLPTANLPWAILVNPITSASISSIGSTHGLESGSWIVGFWMDDNENPQHPCVIGSIASNSSAVKNLGFNDPNGVLPVHEGNDLPKEAYDHENSKSYRIKKSIAVDEVPVAVPPKLSTIAVDESDDYYENKPWSSPDPESTNQPSYPSNHTIRTKSGHVLEFDDTPGNERICLFHRSGSYKEIDASGDEIEMNVGSKYNVVFGSDNVYVKGNMNLTIDGDYRQLVKGSYHLEVEGNKTENIKGSSQRKVELNEQAEIGQEVSTNIGSKEYRLIGDNFVHTINGDLNLKIAENSTTTVTGDSNSFFMGEKNEVISGNSTLAHLKNLTVAVNNEIKYESNGDLTLKGSKIYLN